MPGVNRCYTLSTRNELFNFACSWPLCFATSSYRPQTNLHTHPYTHTHTHTHTHTNRHTHLQISAVAEVYGGTFVSLLFNQHFFLIQSKKTFSIKEKKCLNAKKKLRPKKLHLNTFFLWLKMFFLIENIFFDWSNLFCVWAILWVGHLCLYYSIKKKIQSKKISLQMIFFKVQFYFCIRTLFFFDWLFFFLIEHLFFLIEIFFFVWSAKSFEVFFFWLNHFDTNIPQWADASPLVGHVWVTRLSTPMTFE